ncbi:MAG TPA: carboxypeptidase regulatory-like domain-containing protein, partial [Anaerolineales bacterium]|nr:carboxypeptidase regulatory-like domain-containing protein [Anaerolineales bacterium]
MIDEVTGLELNHQDYQLTQVDAITYSGTFPIPDQAVVKYRYVRRSGARILEDTNTDAVIRYRMVYVNGPTDIADTISSWTDKQANTISGSIYGTVTDQVTGTPLAEIMVTAGGAQALTDSAGRFSLNGLRAGRHNLVAFALDGMYHTFQQGAIVDGNKGTAVELKMNSAPLVNVIFTAALPQNTQAGVPIRIAGSLLQFGNTFSDQRGGLSTIADRMPVMTPTPDGRYSVSLFLPAGAYINYKYTLGDGFWNSEFNTAGQYVTRQMIVPSQNTVIEDTVQSWQAGPNSPILFEVDVPADTPVGDVIYIQFNPFSWTEPIPMWKSGNNRWAYKLYGPLNIVGAFTYRYCRNAQCGSADDASTAGDNARGNNVSSTIAAQNIKDTVNQWAWSQSQASSLVQTDIPARGTTFVAGVEFQQYYDPSLPVFTPLALQNIHALGGNWSILDPSWTYTSSNPITFAQEAGKDPFRKDTTESVAYARSLNLNVALFPQPQFGVDADQFWASAPRDTVWWDSWFNHYRAFAVNFADMATSAD